MPNSSSTPPPKEPLSDAPGAPLRWRRGESVTRGDRRLRELVLKARRRRSPASSEEHGAIAIKLSSEE